MFHATGFAEATVPGTLTGNCGDDPGIACGLAWDLSHSTTAAQVVKVYLAGPASQTGGSRSWWCWRCSCGPSSTG